MRFIRGINIKKSLDIGKYREIPADEFDPLKADLGYYICKLETGYYFVFKITIYGWCTLIRSCASINYPEFMEYRSSCRSEDFMENNNILWVKKLRNYRGPLSKM